MLLKIDTGILVIEIHKMRNIGREIIERELVISVIIEFEYRFVIKRNTWIINERQLDSIENQIRIID